MRLLVLFTRLSGYLVNCLETVQNLGVDVSVVAYPSSPNAPFGRDISASLSVIDRQSVNASQLSDHIRKFRPDTVLVSGWIDKTYLRIAKQAKQQGCVVVGGCDTQLTMTTTQSIRARIGKLFLPSCFDTLWVAGDRQRLLANRLGFTGERCWHGFYTCDVELFTRARPKQSNREFLFVGRLVEEKGIRSLVESYRRYHGGASRPWNLRVVGNGPFASMVHNVEGIHHQSFVSPSELPQLYEGASAFILPSLFEPWGVVLHEAATSGLPLIASTACGAAVHLLSNGANGFTFSPGNSQQLSQRMDQLADQSIDEWDSMGKLSRSLSRQFTPSLWARQLIDGSHQLQDGKTGGRPREGYTPQAPANDRERQVWVATVGLQPNMGGVASVTRSTLKVITKAYPGRVKVISLNNTRESAPDWLPRDVEFVGCGGNRAKFAFECGKQTVRRPEWILFDHIDVAQCQAMIPKSARSNYGVWIHGIEVWKPLDRFRGLGLRNANWILSNSNFTKALASQFHDISERTSVVHLCCESSKTPVEPIAPLPIEGTIKILTVGRLVQDRPKGHAAILSALPKVQQIEPNITWHVAGDGPWCTAFQAQVRQSPAKESIFLHGFVSNQELKSLYRQSHIFCMPSRGEGFGLVYLEAMHHGCVCIGSQHDAAAEVLGESGRLVDLDSPTDLEKALIETIKEVRDGVSRDSVWERVQHFSFERFEDNLLTALPTTSRVDRTAEMDVAE